MFVGFAVNVVALLLGGSGNSGRSSLQHARWYGCSALLFGRISLMTYMHAGQSTCVAPSYNAEPVVCVDTCIVSLVGYRVEGFAMQSSTGARQHEALQSLSIGTCVATPSASFSV